MDPLRNSSIRRRLLPIAGATLAAASACTSATNELHPSREQLGLGDRSSIGKVVTADHGRTVYLFEKDQSGESYCSGACASVWPPVTSAGMPTATAGLDASKLSLIKRGGGLMQVAYHGHPLYYYQGDTSSDDIYGQEKDQFGAEWYAVTASGSPSESNGSHGGSSGGNGTNGGGYGGSYG
jgi:predicted lipoprotein with Yx(FWY)xxD motif